MNRRAHSWAVLRQPKGLSVGSRAVARAWWSKEEAPFLVFLRRLHRNRLANVGAGIFFVVVACALFAPLVAPADPAKQDLYDVLAAPSATHLFGTDELGRDILSRIIYGARVSLQVGVISVVISLVTGVTLGLISGYVSGWTDDAIMRVMDTLLAFPALILTLGITASLGPSLTNAMIAIGIVGIPAYARLVRGQVLSIREWDFVTAARAVGARHLRIMLRHILPNVMAVVIVQSSLRMATAILTESALSFLGLGVQPPTPSWGSMLSAGRGYLETAPWMAMAPGAAIFSTVLGINFLGDGLRDASDPRLKNA